jgi:hypothetical protein
MNAFFAAIEQSGVSLWMREGAYAYFVALIFHAWGMALLVGGALVLSLRWLGFARGAAVAGFRGFMPVLWLGAALAVPSGVLLLLAYPAKALTNPLFAVKLACLVAAALLMRHLARAGREQRLALLALLLWLGVVVTGKLLLHTYTVLTVS